MSQESKNPAPGGGQTDCSTVTENRSEIAEPPLYHVILLNDDFTTMEFVIQALQQVFHKPLPEATKIMLEVHKKGRGVAGTYIRDVARTKAERVMHLAFRENFPLKCILEKA
jgi:ATP-dependent Clp protease adaptor protein ClpS